MMNPIPATTFRPSDDPYNVAARAAIAWNARDCGLSDPGTAAFWANEEIYAPGDRPQYRFLEVLIEQFDEDIHVARLPAPTEAGLTRGTRLLIYWPGHPGSEAHVVWIEKGAWLDPAARP